MQIKEIIDVVEAFAPLSLQELWDNSGVQVGRVDVEATGVLLALDVTEYAVTEAARMGANLIVSHHPLLFEGLKNITPETAEGRIVMVAIENGITIYSSHTPMDSCAGGINDVIASELGLIDVQVLVPSATDPIVGIGRVGELPHDMTVEQFAMKLQEIFDLRGIKFCASDGATIRRVAICSGGGGSLLENAILSGADSYICGDLKYHDFGRATGRISLFDIGHYESEICVTDIFMDIISKKTKKIPTFVLHTLKNSFTRYFL